MSTHTPGPWKAEYRETSLAVYQRTRSGAKTGHPICVVSRKDKANADLIAAAPDLLNACKVALPLLERFVQGAESAHDLLRAAIAKAEGR
jgi:hypothetical protein